MYIYIDMLDIIIIRHLPNAPPPPPLQAHGRWGEGGGGMWGWGGGVGHRGVGVLE
jgi:hypothetical protein